MSQERIQLPDEADLHLGLNLAQHLSVKNYTPLEAITVWMRGQLDFVEVEMDDNNYKILVSAADLLKDGAEKQEYFRRLYREVRLQE